MVRRRDAVISSPCELALIAHEEADDRQDDFDMKAKQPVDLGLVGFASRRKHSWQKDAEHAHPTRDHAQSILVDGQSQPDARRAETLHQQFAVRSVAQAQFAPKAPPGKIATPDLSILRGFDRHVDGDGRSHVWESDQPCSETCKRIVATLDFREAAEFASRRAVMQIAQRGRQFVERFAQQPNVGAIATRARAPTCHSLEEPVFPTRQRDHALLGTTEDTKAISRDKIIDPIRESAR